MLESKQKGIVTQLRCLTIFNEYGFKVSIPYGENSRYDFIVDINNHLLRVQSKTSSGILNEKDELVGIKFPCRSTRVSAQGNFQRKYTKDEIDYFCTFWNGICYVIPVEECSNEKTLRFFYPSSGQKQKISLVEDYTIEKQWAKYLFESQTFEKVEDNLNFIKQNNKQYKKNNTCIKCGSIITDNATFCAKCVKKENRIVKNRPSREELKQLIRTLPFTQIGNKYGVTDNAIRKWCDNENLPKVKSEINAISDEDWINI